MTMNAAAVPDVPAVDRATRLYGPREVAAAFDRMAEQIDARLVDTPCLVLAILQGGVIPAGQLLPRLRAPVELDAVHLTRYRNSTAGGAIEWRSWPATPMQGRTVLLLDDILDEGHSLAAVAERCRGSAASEIIVAVLVEKRHARKNPRVRADFVGLEVDDRYVFGYGMDYRGFHRNAPGIFAVEDE